LADINRYIASLQNRIQWLETLLTDNCPEIDLRVGPRVIQEDTGYPAPSAEVAPVSRVDEPVDRINPAISNEFREASDDNQPDRLAHEIGLVSVTGGQDPRYIVSYLPT
jgi:hypothetical protein